MARGRGGGRGRGGVGGGGGEGGRAHLPLQVQVYFLLSKTFFSSQTCASVSRNDIPKACQHCPFPFLVELKQSLLQIIHRAPRMQLLVVNPLVTAQTGGQSPARLFSQNYNTLNLKALACLDFLKRIKESNTFKIIRRFESSYFVSL